MADQRIVVQKLKRAGNGITPSYEGSLQTSNVYQVNNDGRVFLQFKKSQATDCVVTFRTPGSVDGNAIAELTVTVPASTGDKMIGEFDPTVYNVLGAHDLEFTLSHISGLTVGAFLLE